MMARKKSTLSTLDGKTGVIYARYSSHAQNDASIEQQVEKCEAYARAAGVRIIEIYADRAMSGKNDKRPEFQRMLRDSAKGKFEVVIAWKSNRIGRNMVEALVNDSKLLDNGVETRYVEEDFDDSAAGRFALRSMMNLNQFYSENMAEDIYRGLEDAAKKGRCLAHVPLGYRKSAEGTFEVNPDTAPIVREIFTRYTQGETLASIIDDFNARGLRTSRGGLWNKNSFSKLLTNERYKGVYKWSDIRIEGGVPAIIDEDTFARAQEILAHRGAVNGRRHGDIKMDFLLTGKLYCGHCGKPMRGTSGTSKGGKTYYYYACASGDKSPVRKDIIEPLIAKAIQENVMTDDVINWIADNVLELQDAMNSHSQLQYYKDRMDESQKALNNLMRAVENGLVSTTVTVRIADLEKEIAEFQKQIKREEKNVSSLTREMIIFYFEKFRTGKATDATVQKQLFKQFVERINLYDDHCDIRFGYGGELAGKPEGVRIEYPISHQSTQSRTRLVIVEDKLVLTLWFK